MPGNDDKKKVLYDAVSKEYDLGTYDEFSSKLQDPTKRKALYDAIGQDYDLGDYTTFNQKLGYDSDEVKQKSNLPFIKTAQETLGQATSGKKSPVNNWSELEDAIQGVNQAGEKLQQSKSYNTGTSGAFFSLSDEAESKANIQQQAQKEYEGANQFKEQVFQKYQPQLKEVIQPLVESGKYKDFFDKAGNFKSGDAIEYADKIVKEKGGGTATRDVLVNLMKQVGEFKQDEPKREEIRTKFKQSGKQFTDADIEKELAAKKDMAAKGIDEALSNVLPLGLFNRSAVSGWYRGLANIGDYLSMKGVDNNLSKYLQSKSYEADVTQPANYAYNKDEWFKRLQTSVGSSLGASAPITIPALGATLATGGLGAPEAIAAAVGGAIGFKGEQAQNTGEVYRQMMEQTGDAAKAYEAASKFEKAQYITAPLYFLEGLGMHNLIKGGVKKVITGQLQELAQELPTEYYQGYTQEVATTGQDNGFGQYIKENPELAVDVIAGTVGQGGIMAGAGKVFQSINSKIPNAPNQLIADMVDKQGAQFAYENIQHQLNIGAITEGEAKGQTEQVDKIASQLTDLKQLGLQGDDAKAFQTVNDTYSQLQERLATEQNEGIKIALEAKANALKSEMQQIVQGNGTYAVVTMPGGADATRIIPATEIQNMRKSGSLDGLILESAKIEVPNDSTLNRYFEQKKEELGNPKDAPQELYQEYKIEEPINTGDIATEQQNVTDNGEGQRREEGRQDVLNQPEEIKQEDIGASKPVEEPVSSIENKKADIERRRKEELSNAPKDYSGLIGKEIPQVQVKNPNGGYTTTTGYKFNGVKEFFTNDGKELGMDAEIKKEGNPYESTPLRFSDVERIANKNGLDDLIKVDKKAQDKINAKYDEELKALENETKVKEEIPIKQGMEGSNTGNEYVRAEESGNTETTIPEITSDTGAQPPIPTEPNTDTGSVEPETDQRRFTQQMMRTEDLSPENKAAVAKTLDYIVQTNAMSMDEANQILNTVNEDAAVNMVISGNGIKPAVRVVLAQALIKKFNDAASTAQDEETKNYYNDKAIQVATFTTERLATEPGQMIQAFSLWSRLSPEAQFRAAVQDAAIIGKERKRRTKKDVDKLGDKLKEANEQAANEVVEDKEVKDTVEKTDNERIKKAKTKIAKAKAKRAAIIKNAKKSAGKLYDIGALTGEGIKFVAEIAATYIEEGVANIEILVQKIKESLKEASGKDVPNELNEQINTIADDRLNRSDMRLIGEQLKSQKLKINDIIKQHYTKQEEVKKSLSDKLIEQAGLTGEEAKELADKVNAAFDRIATRRKKQILFQEKARFDRVKKGLKGANTVDPKTLQGEMIRYSNLGAFDNDEFAEMIAEKLGTGKIAPEQAAKITELSNKIEQAPEGSPKNDATEDLLAYRANLKGTNWAEIAQGVWYANVLSGYKTHEKNIVSTFFNGVGELTAQVAKNPKEAPFILYGLLKGLRRGGLEAAHTITTGRSPIHVKKIETPNVLERKEFVGGKFNPANWLKFVTRLMVGEDVLQFQGLKEARAYQLASREVKQLTGTRNPFSKEVWDKVDELLLNTKDRYEEALQQAKDEGLKSTIDIKRRVYELMESSRPVPMTEDAYGFAAHGTFNHEVEGTLGALTNAISSLIDVPVAGFQPLRFVVPFTRIITNVVNSGLNYTPVGYLRAARGKRGFESFKDYGIAKKAYVKLTNEQRQELIAKASIGVGIAISLYALSKMHGDDGEQLIEITGGGTGDYKKDQQLRDTGWQEYSIKVGDTYYSYKLTPLIFMLGFVGNMNDKEKYAPNEDEATMLKQLEVATYRTGHLISDNTWINSGGTLLGALSQPNPSGGNEIGNALQQSVKGAVVPQAYTQVAQEIENIMRLPQKQVNNMWENMVQDIPIARNKLNDKINALGDPIIRDVDVITSSETTDPVWRFLLDKGGWVAPVNKKSMVIFDGKEERAITDEEYYTFSKIRGQKIKQAILSLIQNGAYITAETDEEITDKTTKAQELTKGELQTILKKISSAATKETKDEMFNPDKTGKPKVTIEINE